MLKYLVHHRSANKINFYFNNRLSWILRNHPDVIKAEKENDLLFGTLDSWLVYKLNGGHKHVTEPSNSISTGNIFIKSMH